MTPPRHVPRKRFGQHFLSDPRILARIAAATEAGPHSTVVEIGPGRGALTRHLLGTGARVVAVEIDRDLAAALASEFAGDPRLTIVTGDVLDRPLAALAGGEPYTVAGNIPYNITTPIIFHALRRPRPARIVLLVQREVADRLAARPGSGEYGALSVNLSMLAASETLFRVPPGAFAPPPKVESAVVRIVPHEHPAIGAGEEEPFRTLVIGAFGMRRKQMGRVMRSLWSLGAEAAVELLTRAGIEPTRRPETLAPDEFLALLRARRPGG